MKFSIAVVVAIVAALVAPSHQANLPIKSELRTVLVDVLEFVNQVLNSVENYSNNYFIEKLQNHTQIQEWSVNIQNGVTSGVTEVLFDIFNAYRLSVEASSPANPGTKVLDCISEQKSNILAVVKNATTLNGWCNNRMAANLTTAFQETTAATLSANAEFKNYIESFKTCPQGDAICLTEFVSNVVKLASNEVSGESGTISAGLKDVIAVYKIMFGQDVPACNKKYFTPILVEGISKAREEITNCAA